jgi:endonuclease/exonuclease/phosphatase family metal-dependent hydrolase
MTVIGTWNLENLFRPGGEFGPAGDAAYEAKLHSLAATINDTALDALGVEEVGDPDALADLVKLLDGDWHLEVSEHFEAAHPIRVGVISRLPTEVVADVAAVPAALRPVQSDDDGGQIGQTGRGALAVRVRGDGVEPVMVVCHLKSKLLSFPSARGGAAFQPRDEGQRARYAAYALYRRTAESVTVRGLADDLLGGHGKERPVMIVGDLNDEPLAATTQILNGPPGSELGTAGAERPDQGDDVRMWNLAPLIPAGERFSRVFNGRHELIDHIFVSHALLGRVREVHTVTAHPLPSMTEDPHVRRNAPASDHAMVLARMS